MQEGVISYMDKSLPMVLLYKQELAAYAALRQAHPDTPPSKLYGGEHLLRLVVTIPAMLKKAEMSQRSMAALQPRLQELLRYTSFSTPPGPHLCRCR